VDYRWVQPIQLASERIEGHAVPVDSDTVPDDAATYPLLPQFYTAKCGALILVAADDQDVPDGMPLCDRCAAAVEHPEVAAAVAEALPLVPVSGGEVVSADTDPVVVLVRKRPEVTVFPVPHWGESRRVVHITPLRLDIAPPARFRAYCGFSWTWDDVETVRPGKQAGAFCSDCWGLWITDREASRQAGGAS
jgi:hypothetical protein